MDAKFDPYRSGSVPQPPVQIEREVEIPSRMKQLAEGISSLDILIDQLQKRLEFVSGVPVPTPPREDKRETAISPLGTFLVDEIVELGKLNQRIHNIINALQI